MSKKNTKLNLSKAGLLLAFVAFLAVQVTVSAAVGDDKKKQKGVVLRVEGFDFGHFGKSETYFFRRPGSFYASNFSLLDKSPQSAGYSNIQTFKQGNTVYIVPQKSKSKIPLSKFKVPEKPRN